MSIKELRDKKMNCHEYIEFLIKKGYRTVKEAMDGVKND